MKPKYKCMNKKCNFEFETKKPMMVVCNVCGSEYVEWVNYKEILEELYEKIHGDN